MKPDTYTKTVLTVIALALCTIALQNFNLFNSANAKTKQILADEMNVNIKSIGGSSIYGEIPVNLKAIGGSSFYGSTLPVNIKEISGSSIGSKGISVNIDAINGSSIYGDALPVKNK